MNDAPTVSIRIDFKKIIFYIKVLAILSSIILVGALGRHYYYRRILTKTTAFIDLGLGTLATEYIDPHREYFVDSTQGCQALLKAYGMSKLRDKLRWAVEGCRYYNIRIVEMPLAAAQIEIMDGNPSYALQHFGEAMEAFKDPAGLFGAVGILKSQRQDAGALNLVAKGLLEFPNDDRVAVLALRLYSKAKKMDEVRLLAARLKPLAEKFTDMGVRKLVAEGLIAGGDKEYGQRLLDSIKSGVAGAVQPTMQPSSESKH